MSGKTYGRTSGKTSGKTSERTSGKIAKDSSTESEGYSSIEVAIPLGFHVRGDIRMDITQSQVTYRNS
jgi:hypothetical protein